MPSSSSSSAKSKKQSKSAASKLSSSSDTINSSSSPSAKNPDEEEFTEQELLQSLREASRRFPSLVSESAFIATVSEAPSSPAGFGNGGCKIWLSESAMLSANIPPASLVSVSIPSSTKYSSNFPLSSVSSECAKHFGVEFAGDIAEEAGSYFTLATVFPSCKVSKNEVRLSSNLSCTMGVPHLGRTVFVYPICILPQSGIVNGNGKLHGASPGYFSLLESKELYLSLVNSKGKFTTNSIKSSDTEFPDKANPQPDLSPKTPLRSQSKFSSFGSRQLSTPALSDSMIDANDQKGPSSSGLDIREVLEVDASKKLLETCIASWLSSRNLLSGNLVVIPIGSGHLVFQVTESSKLSANSKSENLADKSNHDFILFNVGQGTKMRISLLDNHGPHTPSRRLFPCTEGQHGNIKANPSDEFFKLGGLSKEFSVLKDIIVSSTVKGTLASMGLRPTKGVLLHGPPGTGKTVLARLCAQAASVNLFTVKGAEIVSQYSGESERALLEVFESATQAVPAVVFIDELDAIAPARRDGGEELSQRMVASLLNLMDGISRADGVLVIAATNRPDSIEPALRRPGRLDREIEIGVPSPKQRHEIVHALLSEMEHSLSDIDIQHLATATHGFVGADLAALCNEAALVCLRRYVHSELYASLDSQQSTASLSCSSNNYNSAHCLGVPNSLLVKDNVEETSSSSVKLNTPTDTLNGIEVYRTHNAEDHNLRITFEDFEKARMKIKPSAMREVILEVPKVSWEDVGGQREVKMQLMEAVEWPQKHQDAFKRIGTRPPTGVLMFGPPGCSKTLLARAVASESGLNFLAVKGPELFSKWVGESEKAVKSLFAKARANAPSIIFFDEIDGLAVIRGKESDGVSVADRVMSQLLIELDGLHQRVDVTVIAATNRPDKIDPALLRPGRFDRLLFVGPPNGKDREDVFRVCLKKIPCSSDVCIRELAFLTEGFTGADISLVCREAAIAAMEESLDASEITMKHLQDGIKQLQPSEIQSYEKLSTKFQRLVRLTSEEVNESIQVSPSKSQDTPPRTTMGSIAHFLCRFPASLWQSDSPSIR